MKIYEKAYLWCLVAAAILAALKADGLIHLSWFLTLTPVWAPLVAIFIAGLAISVGFVAAVLFIAFLLLFVPEYDQN